ncbi:hypothetical protein F4775DRAFT_238284 [Biscogniauxia sp. FL1348]|nr:hypothetical protein F4775DRAFT_238284 [Biscogniauxia sp. FL1348]
MSSNFYSTIRIGMPEKRVTFQSSSSPRGSSRPSYQSSRTSTRDSGFGSLPSDQAGVGGMQDRTFTAQDYNFQSNSIPALREALAEASEQLEVWKNRYARKEKELSEANKTNKSFKLELDNHYHHIQELDAKNIELEEELESWTEQYNYLSHALTEYEEENRSLRQTIQSMAPTSGQPLPRTSGSRSRQERESKELTDRMKQRLSRNKHSPNPTSSRRSVRRPSVSVIIPAGASGGKEPYIEEVPHPLRRSRRESVSHNRSPGDYHSHSLADRTRRQV